MAQLAAIARAEQLAEQANTASLTKWLFSFGGVAAAALISWLGVEGGTLPDWILTALLFTIPLAMFVMVVAHLDEKRAGKAVVRARAYREVQGLRQKGDVFPTGN